MQKVLVMGGTGVMGAHLVPELLKLGFMVDVVSLEDKVSADPNLRYFIKKYRCFISLFTIKSLF